MPLESPCAGHGCTGYGCKGTEALWQEVRSGGTHPPARFATVEEFEQFWDTHSLADYDDVWREVQFNVKLASRKPTVPLEPGLAREIQKRARKEGVPVKDLVNRWLKQQLQRAA
jgi:hypothetical protein